jgi:hypothetical protein
MIFTNNNAVCIELCLECVYMCVVRCTECETAGGLCGRIHVVHKVVERVYHLCSGSLTTCVTRV